MSDELSPSSRRSGDLIFQKEVGDIGSIVVGDQTVNIGTIQQLHLILSSKELLDESDEIPLSAKLAVTLVDRTTQCDAIVDSLHAWAAVPDLGMVVVVHGSQFDLHRALEMRYAAIEFGNEEWRYLDTLAWPDEGRSIFSVLRPLRDRLGLPKTLDQAGTERAIAGLEENIFFSHYVDAKVWAHDNGTLIRRWIDYLGSNSLHPARGYRLVGFLCVSQSEATEPPSSIFRFIAKLGFGRRALASDAMVQFLDRLQAKFLDRLEAAPPLQENPGSYIVAPPPLTMIRKKHLDEWIWSAGDFLKRSDFGTHFIDLPAKYFSTPEEERHLQDIFQHLAREVADAMPKQARFQEKPA